MGKQFEGKVLIVDDEIELLDIFKSELEASGFDVTTASNGQEALDAFGLSRFDLVITDICMPWMNGADFLAKLRQVAADSRTYVFAISGHSLFSEDQLKELGASALIQKPFDYRQVIEMLKVHIQMIRMTEMSEEISEEKVAL